MSDNVRREKEEEYFLKKQAELLEKMRARHEEAQEMKRLQKEFGVEDERVIRAFEELGFTRETVSLLHVYPLLQVGWADGSISSHERAKILEAAAIRGVVAGTPAYPVLEGLLANRPGPEVYETALKAIGLIEQSLPADKRARAHDSLVALCTAVASASGGFLGLGSKVSDAEQNALARIAQEMTAEHPDSAKQVVDKR